MRTLLFVVALALPASLATAQEAAAQEATSQDASAEDAGHQTCRQVSPGHLECGEMRIVGRSPSAFYLLSRTRPLYELPPLRRDLAREVRRSVRRTPF